ncbi:MAG: hypothetical protein HFG54_09195 [Lachnospiraceae bacterium]|jgi:hypothetical protein|nr:hypothetical protein [Lachnospiraceae bacterium]
MNKAEKLNEIRKWVVNDYFTPNIKAEVILDTLLTPYVTEILKNQAKNIFSGELCFITKEMSILESEESEENSDPKSEESEKGSRYGNMGTKIDYVLGDEKAVYLVELKTTNSSIKQEQARRYLRNCHGKTFGEVFGNKLLRVMGESFAETYKKDVYFPKPSQFDKAGMPMWDKDEVLRDAFSLVFKTWYLGKKYGMDMPSGRYAEAAMELIKKAEWTQKDGVRSRKYLYTTGQLLDYLYPDKSPERNLWHKPLRLIYLTPEGEDLSELFNKAQDRENWRKFYIGSFSLKEAGNYLEAKQDQEKDELALLLSDIIKSIYMEEEKSLKY